MTLSTPFSRFNGLELLIIGFGSGCCWSTSFRVFSCNSSSSSSGNDNKYESTACRTRRFRSTSEKSVFSCSESLFRTFNTLIFSRSALLRICATVSSIFPPSCSSSMADCVCFDWVWGWGGNKMCILFGDKRQNE